MYSSGDANLDNVNFNITFNYLQFGILPVPYSINVSTFVTNTAPVFNTSRVNASGTVYYVTTKLGTGAPVAPGPTNWGNDDGQNTTRTTATNGGNTSNFGAGTGITWDLFVKSPTIFGASGYVLASSINGLALSLVVLQESCNLFVGKFSEEYVSANIEVEIRATDQNGNGLTSTISTFDLRLQES